AIVALQLLNREDGGGKIPASEILSVTPKISSLISEGRIDDIYPLMVEGSGEGMSTFSSSLTALYESGVISKDDAIKHDLNKSDMKIANDESKEPPAAVQDDVMMSWL
ncbi:MAG: type IV pili twitching motility protein PilT, partial [bacterium]|nr:type IV pili twitching motility protein PilT [bacterium]